MTINSFLILLLAGVYHMLKVTAVRTHRERKIKGIMVYLINHAGISYHAYTQLAQLHMKERGNINDIKTQQEKVCESLLFKEYFDVLFDQPCLFDWGYKV